MKGRIPFLKSSYIYIYIYIYFFFLEDINHFQPARYGSMYFSADICCLPLSLLWASVIRLPVWKTWFKVSFSSMVNVWVFKCITSDASHNLEPYKHLISRAVEDIIWVIRKHWNKELMRQKKTFCSNLKRTNFYCFITDKYSKSKIFCFALIFYLQWNLLFA